MAKTTYTKITQMATLHGCYKAGGKQSNTKLLWHSTGADNANARRYAGRDDTKSPIGANRNNNGFNQVTDNNSRNAKGEVVPCPHAVLGLGDDGKTMLFVEILPKDYVCWCSGSGSKGYAGNANNNGYYQVEVCEDKSLGRAWAERCYNAMVEFSTEFFRGLGIGAESITRANLTCHSEGYEDGIASNHGDPFHWLGKYGYSMTSLRNDVRVLLGKDKPKQNSGVSVGDIVCFKGGDVYISSGADTAASIRGKSVCKVTQVFNGTHPYHLISEDKGGVYGWVDAGCIDKVYVDGGDAATNKTTKSADEIAREVIRGDWGNGEDRKRRLTTAGYDYGEVQRRVNEMIG